MIDPLAGPHPVADGLALELSDEIRRFFSPDGVLARSWSGYRPRDGQRQMAMAIGELVVQGGGLVVEAGTGVGKTFAYLVPALLSGKTTLISTATKALQDQVYWRDLPAVCDLIGRPVRTALLKGRSSYLCRERYDRLLDDPDRVVTRSAQWANLRMWAARTVTGDLSEVAGLQDADPLIPAVTSTRDNCLGTACPQHGACHLVAARREAMTADVLVVNHHLFFADVGVRESGFAELLPRLDVLVFDEAHQLSATGTQFFAQTLSTHQVEALAYDLAQATSTQLASGHTAGAVAAALIWATQSDSVRRIVQRVGPQRRVGWLVSGPESVAQDDWVRFLADVRQALETLYKVVADAEGEISPMRLSLAARTQAMLELCDRFESPPAPDVVRCLETPGQRMRVVEMPLRIGDRLARCCGLEQPGDVGQEPGHAQGARRAVVFTSATLGEDDKLAWFSQRLDLDHLPRLRVESPFDYPHQSAVFVDGSAPDPADTERHVQHVADLAWEAGLRLDGSTMVLTTSLRAMERIGARLRDKAQGTGGHLSILVQGDASKRHLLEQFRHGASDCVGQILVASMSFWEGIDVPGDALRCLVIDKIPFPVPSDPVHKAHAAYIESNGGRAFFDYSLPEAIVLIKQGAGRLIRSERDVGALVICDPRVVHKAYGRRLMAALPPMKRLSDRRHWLAYLDSITKSSTTDLQPGGNHG